MSIEQKRFTTPVGRLVQGSVYEPRTKDMFGNPRVIKTGDNAGKPDPQYFFAIAIPKTDKKSWKEEPWGQLFVDVATQHYGPKITAKKDFYWKVIDGDDDEEKDFGDRKIRACDREGFKDNWVVKFSSRFPPKIVDSIGKEVIEPDYIKAGYWVQVGAYVGPNGEKNDLNPGLFMNHRFVSWQAYGKEITFGDSAEDFGFGQAPLPAGASRVPESKLAANLEVLDEEAEEDDSDVPPPPPEEIPPLVDTVKYQMTSKAKGRSFESYVKAGWNEELLRQHGYLV